MIARDHKGNTYRSLRAMAKAYNMHPVTLWIRLEKYPLEKALTLPVKCHNKIKCKDHLGNQYESLKDMARAYNLSYSLFSHRRQKGWGLEQTLTTPNMNKK